MLDKREEYRRRRDFDAADRIKEQLYTMGVRVDDVERSWAMRTDAPGGGGGGGYGGGGGGYGGGGGGGGMAAAAAAASAAAGRGRRTTTRGRRATTRPSTSCASTS